MTRNWPESLMTHKPALWMLIGLIGCGKTTYSKRIWDRAPSRTIRICLDDIIQMMTFYYYQRDMQPFYWELEMSPLIRGLSNGFSVILDRTNLNPGARARYLQLVSMIRNLGKKLSAVKLPSDLRLISFHEQQRITCQSIMKALESDMSSLDAEPGSKGDEALNLKVMQALHEAIEKNFAATWEISLFESKEKPEDRESIFSFLNRIANLESIGVYFDVPIDLCLRRRENDPAARARDIHKKVNWKSVMCQMKDKILEPALDEGFDRIIRVNEDMKIISEVGQKSLF